MGAKRGISWGHCWCVVKKWNPFAWKVLLIQLFYNLKKQIKRGEKDSPVLCSLCDSAKSKSFTLQQKCLKCGCFVGLNCSRFTLLTLGLGNLGFLVRTCFQLPSPVDVFRSDTLYMFIEESLRSELPGFIPVPWVVVKSKGVHPNLKQETGKWHDSGIVKALQPTCSPMERVRAFVKSWSFSGKKSWTQRQLAIQKISGDHFGFSAHFLGSNSIPLILIICWPSQKNSKFIQLVFNWFTTFKARLLRWSIGSTSIGSPPLSQTQRRKKRQPFVVQLN